MIPQQYLFVIDFKCIIVDLKIFRYLFSSSENLFYEINFCKGGFKMLVNFWKQIIIKKFILDWTSLFPNL